MQLGKEPCITFLSHLRDIPIRFDLYGRLRRHKFLRRRSCYSVLDGSTVKWVYLFIA